MSTEIKWTDTDPRTGERRYLRAPSSPASGASPTARSDGMCAVRDLKPTREMWEIVLDSLKRRYRRREGVSEEDVAQVERVLREWPEPPSLDDEGD